MLIFDYSGPDPESDRGRFDIAITAPNRVVADQHLRTQLRSKGWLLTSENVEGFFKQSRMLGRDGLLYSNLEQRIERDDEIEAED